MTQFAAFEGTPAHLSMALAGLTLLLHSLYLAKNLQITSPKLATKVGPLVWPLPPSPPEADYQGPAIKAMNDIQQSTAPFGSPN